MGLDKSSDSIGVSDYFSSPINNQYFFGKYFKDGRNITCPVQGTNLSKYLNEKAISDMITVNSEIKNILSALKIPIKINLKILNNLLKNHLPQTRSIAFGIAKHLPKEYRRFVDLKALSEATILHDLAKVIIPESIINKQGALNSQERAIMHHHANLSYELLKSTDLAENTLELIKHHHFNFNCEDEKTIFNVSVQVLSMADIYSALREKRSYKEAMSKEKSLDIIKEEVEKGKFAAEIYNALVKFSELDEKESLKFKFNWKIFNLKPINSFCS